tara:strand:- start:10257 stop:10532 length:276 start_codon:yes stop_codon:yes gene_type:complete
MIKINDKFSTEKDKYQWLLHELNDGVSKTGEAIKTTRTTYHPSLKMVCRAIADRQAGECESVKEILTELDNFACSLEMIFDGREVELNEMV